MAIPAARSFASERDVQPRSSGRSANPYDGPIFIEVENSPVC